jgi:hypothetical protein
MMGRILAGVLGFVMVLVGAGSLLGHVEAGMQAKAKATPTGVALAWTQSVVPANTTCTNGAPSAAVTGNSVYRGTSAGGENSTAITVSTTPIVSYLDTFPLTTPGITYFYKVSATNCNGEGPLSTEVSAAIANPAPPAAPTGVTAKAQ